MSTSDTNNENKQEASSLGMSDEDFLNSPEPDFEDEVGSADDKGDNDESSADEDKSDHDKDSDDANAKEGDGSSEPGDEEASDEDSEADDDDSGDDSDDTDGDVDAGDDGDASDNADDSDDKPDDTDSKTDYEAEHKNLLKPFRASGREMSVANVDEARRLMQMGADYNRKMAGMKPSMKILKTLDKAGLLDEKKISFFIDLDKKNPAAIAQLLKDSKIDPLDNTLDKEGDYKASDHSVSDSEVDLDMVMDEIKDSPTYNQVLEVVGSKWDAKSKQAVSREPQILKVINDHMASGIYERIITEVDKERSFGGLTGRSDIEAYNLVGDKLHAAGKFADLFPEPDAGKNQQQERKKPPARKAKSDTVRRAERRAAGSSKQKAPGSGGKKDYSPLAMTDEEFLASGDPSFI
jgi:hypothetical protein